jgi:hypothetical protein
MRYYLSLILLLFSLACRKSNSGTDLPSPLPTAQGYFIANIDGKLINAQVINNGIFDTVQETPMYSRADSIFFDSANNTQVMEFQEGAQLGWATPNIRTSYIYLTFYKDSSATNDAYTRRSLFINGNFPNQFHNHFHVHDRIPASVVIDYLDVNSNFWSSRNGDQSGSSFEITDVNIGSHPNSQVVIKATFSCRLYDSPPSTKYITIQKAIFMGGVIPK